MAINTEKNTYTVIFAMVMVIVVGAILAGLASGLKPLVKANERYEKQQNILYAMGVHNNQSTGDVSFISTEVVEEEFAKYIKKQYVIKGDEVTENDQAYLIDIKKEETKAKDPNYQRRLPLFIGEKDGQEVYIVPVRGKGLWDAIWGFVAMDKNMTVQGVYFDHRGETPGLGANIKERFFMDDFSGEKMLDENGDFEGIKVAKGNNDPKNKIKDDHEVDAIAGSTITGDGVTAMLKKDIQMYVSFFSTLN